MAPTPQSTPRAVVLDLSFQLTRNLVIQAAVALMTAVTALSVVAWPVIVGWSAAVVLAASLEDQLFRMMGRDEALARAARSLAPTLRILTTTLYAAATLMLFLYGGSGERLYASALMSCSMVYVLMRYYRAPAVFLATISPYIAVLAFIGFRLVSRAVESASLLGVVTAAFPMIIFGLLFWSARAQLAHSWMQLLEAREAAEQRERAANAANQAKSHFLAAMSHEIRTPLNGVLGMAQAMTAEELSAAQRERLKIIRRSGESLLSVLNDLLDLSKIEASALELEVGEFDLEHLSRGVAAAFQPTAEKKALAFEVSVAPDARGRYCGDSARIRRILYNLVGNAVKFTDQGGVTLAVSRQDDQLVFKVSDTGVGIAPEHMPHLFEGFFQADPSLTRRHAGAGLGLAICRELCALMGGSIEAASVEGEGSAFTVRLPAQPAPEVQPEPEAASRDGDERPAELRVLAAEDNETNQMVLKTLLMQAGITPVFVGDGRQALAAWEEQTWDVILMDIQMPVMDGVATARAIRLREAETGRVRTPIVAVTANAMTHQVVEYEAAGMDGVVPKPVEITRLFAVMEQALDQAEAAQAETARAATA